MATKKEKLGRSVEGLFSKTVAKKVRDSGAVGTTYVPRDPAEIKADILADFAQAQEFFDAMRDNALTEKNKAGEDVTAACMKRDTLRAYLGTKSETANAVQGALKRHLAMAGIISSKGKGRTIIYSPEDDEICIYIERMEKAPGKNQATQVVHAKGAVQGSEKFGSLITKYNAVGLNVDTTEAQVVAWLKETGRFTGTKKPRKTEAKPKAVKAKGKKK